MGGLNAELFGVYVFGVELKKTGKLENERPRELFLLGTETRTGHWRVEEAGGGELLRGGSPPESYGAQETAASTVSLSHNITFPIVLANKLAAYHMYIAAYEVPLAACVCFIVSFSLSPPSFSY